jgi:hypothetical protein
MQTKGQSKSEIDRLGNRLKGGQPTDDDLNALAVYRRSFGESYETVVGAKRDVLRLEPTGRPAKSTTSLIGKLQRETIRLSQVQDIAGCRLIVRDLLEQDRVKATHRVAAESRCRRSQAQRISDHADDDSPTSRQALGAAFDTLGYHWKRAMIFLIEYDRSRGRLLTFRKFQDDDRGLAEKLRLDIELARVTNESNREVVLLDAASEEALRITHRRYFQNPREIVETARKAAS